MNVDNFDLESLSISLRELENRITTKDETIKQVIDKLCSECPCESIKNYNLSISCLKVLSNYVADVPENCKYVFELIKDEIFFLPGNVNMHDIDINTLNTYINIQLILLNNILTTSSEVISKSNALKILDKLYTLTEICRCSAIEIDGDSVIEILNEFYEIIKNIDLHRYLSLRTMCLTLTDKSKEQSDSNLAAEYWKILLKYSTDLDLQHSSEDELLSVFFQLFTKMRHKDDENILLNLSFEFNLTSIKFIDAFLSEVFMDGLLKENDHIPMSLLILSNSITSLENLNYILSKIDSASVVHQYFTRIYPHLKINTPCELQSISFFNKLPLNVISVEHNALLLYIKKLSELIDPTALKYRNDLIVLQLQFLSKILASSSSNNNDSVKQIMYFLNNFNASKKYGSYTNEFKQNLNMLTFQYLNLNKGSEVDENVQLILKCTLIEADRILDNSIKEKSQIQFKYLFELSKIFGFYVKEFKNEEWFRSSFERLCLVINTARGDTEKQNGETANDITVASTDTSTAVVANKNEETGWKALHSNIQYTTILIDAKH